jgi:hypothetical protein
VPNGANTQVATALCGGAIEFSDVRDADALLEAINILQVRAAATVNLLEP